MFPLVYAERCYKKHTCGSYHGVHGKNVAKDVMHYTTHHCLYKIIIKDITSNIIIELSCWFIHLILSQDTVILRTDFTMQFPVVA